MTFIEFLNWLLKVLCRGSNHNGGSNEDKPVEFGVCRDIDILNFWDKHKVSWTAGPKFGMEDTWFHYPLEAADWLEVYYDYATICPPYTPNTEEEAGFDCDDFADGFASWAKVYSERVLGKRVNAAWEIWGETPQGAHAWNAVKAGDGMYEIEPQTGEVWVFGSNPGYKAIIAK